jgi:hypothetical protein
MLFPGNTDFDTQVHPINEMTPVKVPCYPLETPIMTLVNPITEKTPVKIPYVIPRKLQL